MKVGDIVTVYDDPLTETGYSNKARLLKYISNCGMFKGDEIEMWEVHYLDDDNEGSYSRQIRKRRVLRG